MRRLIYCTSKIKYPKYFANMCNIIGTEQVFPTEFEDYVQEKYGLEVSDLSDDEFDQYFAEYRDSIEESTVNEVSVSEDTVESTALDLSLDAPIRMQSDGSWDFDDTSWAVCAETSDGSWMSSDDRVVATPDGLINDVSALLQLYLPIEEGTFNITGDIHLVYDMSEEESMFDIAHSTVKNFLLADATENEEGEDNEDEEDM